MSVPSIHLSDVHLNNWTSIFFSGISSRVPSQTYRLWLPPIYNALKEVRTRRWNEDQYFLDSGIELESSWDSAVDSQVESASTGCWGSYRARQSLLPEGEGECVYLICSLFSPCICIPLNFLMFDVAHWQWETMFFEVILMNHYLLVLRWHRYRRKINAQSPFRDEFHSTWKRENL